MNLKSYFEKAIDEGFAIGAFNFNNMETLQAITSSCEKNNSPAMLCVSESAIKYMGENMLLAMFNAVQKKGFFLHLDHGKTFEVCKKCVDLGFDSVMIDGSSLPFEKNIDITKKVVDYAHSKGVLVEGELGVLAGVEDEVSSNKNIYTNPIEAKQFVEKTNVDSLAIAIGTSHGAYKFDGNQTLRIDILNEIENLLPNFPLVLHGASTVDKSLVERINQNGGDIKKATGVSKSTLIEIVRNHNVVKINTDTDIRLALTGGIRETFTKNPSIFDPRAYLKNGSNIIQEVIEDKINNLLFSNDKM